MVTPERRIETAKTVQVNRRNYRRARDRALARLAGIHREDYLHLLEEERKADATQGKKWLDISGRTGNSAGPARHTKSESTQDKSQQALSNQGSPRNLGGEA